MTKFPPLERGPHSWGSDSQRLKTTKTARLGSCEWEERNSHFPLSRTVYYINWREMAGINGERPLRDKWADGGNPKIGDWRKYDSLSSSLQFLSPPLSQSFWLRRQAKGGGRNQNRRERDPFSSSLPSSVKKLLGLCSATLWATARVCVWVPRKIIFAPYVKRGGGLLDSRWAFGGEGSQGGKGGKGKSCISHRKKGRRTGGKHEAGWLHERKRQTRCIQVQGVQGFPQNNLNL